MRPPLLLPALFWLAAGLGCTSVVGGPPEPACDDHAQACDPDDPAEDELAAGEAESQETASDIVIDDDPPAAELPQAAAAGNDKFGVKKLYATVGGGREWFLADDAQNSNAEWNASNGGRGKMVKTSTPGVFRVRGGPRLPVKSPSGKAWFRNVEVTGYYKLREKITGDEEMSPMGNYGYQLIVRGEFHRTGTIAANKIAGGVKPPAGTKVGPGYPFSGTGQVKAPCLAASYHTNINVDGRILFKKEVSHTAGYTGGKSTKKPFGGGAMQVGKWYGLKYVVRNVDGDAHVRMETWLDANADGNWVKVTEDTDAGGWTAQETGIDGCGAAPFKYKANQIIHWAGPMVLFRFDNVEADVKWFSVREIAPLP
jgi:hypothetical protein